MSRPNLDEAEHPPPEVRVRLQRILLMPDFARSKADYEFLDRYVHSVTYFADLPPRDRIKYLRIVKGVELEKGEELFHIGDSADAFYCIMYGTLNVVVDFARVSAPTLHEFDEIINRARIHSTFLNPGGSLDLARNATYVVRVMKALECFGDVGLLTSDQLRTASVVANDKTLCMKIDRDAFLELRKNYADRELREKIKFLASVPLFDHWDPDNILRLTGRMERVTHSYNDVVVKEGEPAGYFYFVKHGECRFVKRYPTLRTHHNQPCFAELGSVSSRHYFGEYEVISGALDAEFSVLVSSPSAILYRMDRVDFRQTVLKDPTTEQAMRAECEALMERLSVDTVQKDLNRDADWSDYKRQVVRRVLEKHQQDHASPLLGPRSPRPFHTVDSSMPQLPSPRVSHVVRAPSPANNKSPRSRPNHLSSRVLVETAPPTSPRLERKNSRWLEWAKQRAHSIVNDSDGTFDTNGSPASDHKSNIQWSKPSRIMGGLDNETKITSAIVSLFNPKEASRS